LHLISHWFCWTALCVSPWSYHLHYSWLEHAQSQTLTPTLALIFMATLLSQHWTDNGVAAHGFGS
jgi:hypothetical protein